MQNNYWEEKLATDMKRVLTPVHPSESFRSHLRSNLQLAGQQQKQQRAMRMQRHGQQPNYWVLGAAALGVTLAAGSMIAWAVRTRTTAH